MTLTPIEKFIVGNKEFFVKRDDLCYQDKEAPPFSKMRGLENLLLKLKKQGINKVAYVDTAISMAGFGISYLCKKHNMTAVIYMPKYKEMKYNQKIQHEKIKQFNAIYEPIIKPNYQKVNYYWAIKHKNENHNNTYMLPQGLPIQETIDATYTQIQKQANDFKKFKTIVLCIGSGTMCAGIYKACSDFDINCAIKGITCANKSLKKTRDSIIRMAQINPLKAFKSKGTIDLTVIDAGYEYYDQESCKCDFPCNMNYDRKAYSWMIQKYDELLKPILFWNIGGDYK